MGLIFFWIFFVLIGIAIAYHEIKPDNPITRRINPATGKLYARYTPVYEEQLVAMLASNVYYQKLSAAGKQRFFERTRKIMDEKVFIGMQGLEITDEMRVTVSACIAQLTFGLKKFTMPHFHTIRLYPDIFYSRFVGKKLKGGALTSGYLLLSWKDFVQGFADPEDKYNLGLHETAHALRISVRYGNDFDKDFAGYLDAWETATHDEFEAMHSGRTSFLRAYGGTNIEEFFAVCVEHFFEVPKAFRERLPDLYRQLCVLLNQDPLEATRDYRIPALLEEELKQRPPVKSQRYANWHWSLTVLLSGIFGGVILAIFLSGYVALQSQFLFLIYAGLSVGTLYVFRRLIDPQRQVLGWVQFLAFGFLGAGPLLFSLFVLLNMIPVQSNIIENYKVESIDVDSHVRLYNHAYEDLPALRKLRRVEFDKAWGEHISYRMHFHVGLFGLKQFEYGEIISY